jgi:type II secretory pathway component PulF
MKGKITMAQLNADILITLCGLILSLAFAILPPLKRWFETLGEYKPTFMAGVLALVACVYLLLACNFQWVCIQVNAGHTLLIWVAAFGMNQGTYLAAIKPYKTKAI